MSKKGAKNSSSTEEATHHVHHHIQHPVNPTSLSHVISAIPAEKPKPKRSDSVPKKSSADKAIEHAILKNLVELQKVQTDMAEKFNHLAKEISNLLALFELTARNFAKNAPQTDQYTKDKEFLEKIDRLLDQNKTLAKGLTLMEERMRERMISYPTPQKEKKPEEEFQPSMNARPRPLPKF